MPEQRKRELGEGERLHAQQRRRFWILIGALALLGLLTGLVSGAVADVTELPGPVSPTIMWPAVAGIFVIVLVFIYGSWRFFVSVDEVELADNLWGSMIGFYAYAILLPAWWALDRLGAAPQPDQWVIYAISIGVAFAAYLFRKWRFQSKELG